MEGGKNIVLTGGTGMVGGLALRLCLEHPAVSSVTAIGRRATGVAHPKLREVIHADFSDCSPLAEALAGCDLALFCIGVYTGALPDEEFRKITVDHTAEFARALYEQSPGAAFCFLSGQGADPGGKSRMSFARYKGMAEKALLSAGFCRVHIFRPGYIYPITPRREPNASYSLMRALYPLIRRIHPNIGLSSDELARAMVETGLDGGRAGGKSILENRYIKEAAQ